MSGLLSSRLADTQASSLSQVNCCKMDFFIYKKNKPLVKAHAETNNFARNKCNQMIW